MSTSQSHRVPKWRVWKTLWKYFFVSLLLPLAALVFYVGFAVMTATIWFWINKPV